MAGLQHQQQKAVRGGDAVCGFHHAACSKVQCLGRRRGLGCVCCKLYLAEMGIWVLFECGDAYLRRRKRYDSHVLRTTCSRVAACMTSLILGQADTLTSLFPHARTIISSRMLVKEPPTPETRSTSTTPVLHRDSHTTTTTNQLLLPLSTKNIN
jgi:hypothetical protein